MTEVQIPDQELTLLVCSAAAAIEQVDQGSCWAGYWELASGLQRAREREGDEQWRAALVEHWRLALARFTQRHLPKN